MKQLASPAKELMKQLPVVSGEEDVPHNPAIVHQVKKQSVGSTLKVEYSTKLKNGKMLEIVTS